ncbi:MAG: hypothetical protein CVV42_13570 [Candidatus Riflebacteria bacterium HGW-Riflebacteria-2]|nr:MAG: hypothetical protein CVV42_13570 [Candidatus Riflebacteria bacterium HGW-Riflebacteria-2]
MALQQIQNGSFTTNLDGWYQSAAILSDSSKIATPTFTADNTSAAYLTPRSILLTAVVSNSGSANLYYVAQRYIQQQFLNTTRSTAVNARFTSAHRETVTDIDECKTNHIGTIRKTSAPDTVVGTFHNISNEPPGPFDTAWPAELQTWETQLEAGTSYLLRVSYTLSGYKGNTIRVWIDNINCNVSPADLTASETTDFVIGSSRGKCLLNWDASTGPATGTPVLHLTQPYRLYRSYISDSGPWTQIATLSVTNYLDSPTADIAWYAVSDVDVTGEESPLSVTADYRSARLQITKVETTTMNVTKGQNGLPIKVYVTNPGLTTASLNTIELLFDTPTYGIYTVSPPSPAPPISLAGGQTEIITFLVAVATGSDSGIDYIDASVTGSNTQTLADISDDSSDVKASWLIQEPPNLKLLDIQASSTVYLDQTGAEIYITVRNDGEAAAVWDLWNNTELYFSLGTYLNQRPYGVENPYSEVIYTGQTKTIRYDIDISPYSATGTATLNASMSYVDGNTYNPFIFNTGDPSPPSWTIRSGILKTYRGPAQFPAYVLESGSFNLGNFAVYTKGLNLQPDKDFRLRWYPPTGSQIAQMAATDLSGELYGSITLSSDPAFLGKWRVIVSRVTNEIPLCETYFEVVDPASLSATIDLPDFVTKNQQFVATMTFVNTGGSRIDTASAAALIYNPVNSGTATYISGPTPYLSTVDPYSMTDKTWNFTASTIGSFTVEGKAYGIDSNDLRNLTTASITSNMCIIQDPPVLSITSVNAAENLVYLNQQNLVVEVGVINNGSASALIQSAQLNFSAGTHFQTLESPELDYLLTANTPTTLRFLVAIASDSAGGAVTITASFTAVDANWLATDPVIVHSTPLSDSWTINTVTGYCSANDTFSPEQYTFNVGQKVYAKYTGITPNTLHRIIYIPSAQTALSSDPNAGSIDSGATGLCITNYTLPAIAGSWKTEIYTITGKSNNIDVVQGRQFFEVHNPGSITASINFVPDDIKLNDEVTLELTIANNVASGSTIENIIPSLPLEYTGSTGELTMLTGPEPASASLPTGTAATFTWTFRSTEHSGLAGTYQMIATATGNDANLPTLDSGYATSATVISNILTIRFRDLEYASASLDFGNMLCGESRTIGNSRVNNTGSTDLVRTCWYKGFYESSLFDTIHPNNLTIYPLSPFAVLATAPSNTSTYAVMDMPYNQPAGSYIATITVFEDMLPYNGVLDAGEPAAQFSSTVTASSCRIIYFQPDTIDLGDWKVGNYVSTQTVTIFNGGNLELTNLKIQKDMATTFTMYYNLDGSGSLATDATRIASISAYVNVGSVDGDYTIAFTAWDDINDDDNIDSGEASATFQVEIGIGTQLMHFTPAIIDFGNGTPTFALPEMSFDITNIGDRTLDRLSYVSANLYNIDQPAYYIPADEIALTFPASITVNATETAYANMYIQAGTAIGTYTGELIIFEDEDGDGTYIGDDNEAPATLTFMVFVNEYRGLRILSPVADAGPLSPTETGLAPFSAKNTGNLVLDFLTWQKVDLISGSDTMASSTYDFEPIPFFSEPFNTIFNATMTLTVPSDQAHGEYTGEYAWLLDYIGVASDPMAPFKVSCQVGTKYVDITEASLLIEDAAPSLLSAAATFEIKNIGTLMLVHPVATSTVFTGPTSIPASASIFTPNTFDFMIANKTFNGTWQVMVPPGTPVGTYNATMTVWNDTNYNNAIESAEASDTASLELRVISKTIIGVIPTTLEFGYVAPERSASVNFSIVNLGNQAITATELRAVASWLSPLSPGPFPIDAVYLEFGPVPFATDLPVSSSVPAVATITIPAGKSTVTYIGTQKVYVDSDAPAGSYTDGEVTATFSARVSVGNKQISVNDVNMGSHAHATTATTNFILSNSGDVNANRITWIAKDIGNGTATLTPTIGPPGAVVAGGTLNCTANVVIPVYTPPGIYTGVQSVYDDDLAPIGVQDISREASDTFLLTLTVATSPSLVITAVDTAFPMTVSLGQKVAVNVTYQNTGNVTLSDLSWGAPMATMIGSDGGTMVPTFSPVPLPALAPGATYIASITFEAGPAQATGTYTGVQTLDSTVYPAASANIAPAVLVVAQTGPKNLEAGTVFQSIATETFSAGDDFIFSVYVGFEDFVPASATIGFRQDKNDDTPSVPMDYVTIDQNGNLDPAGVGGIAGRIRAGNKTWYRLYLNFNGTLDALTESTYLILSNSSSNVGTNVWFDGVQLEKANGRNRPTAYGEGSKIYSPNNRTDLEGKAHYSEW